jgi:competence protein ComGC
VALEGSIKDFGLAEILQLIFLQRKTGILTLKGGEDQATILFDKGLIVDASSSERGAVEKLGEILVRANRIDKAQLKEFLKDQDIAKEKLGQIISESGLIKNEDIKKALSLQKHELIYSLFRWKEGNYHFEQKPLRFQNDIPPLNTEFILMEGIRRLDEWPFLEKVLPSKGLILKKVEGKKEFLSLKNEEPEIDFDILEGVPEGKTDGYQLNPDEFEVYHLADGERDVRTIIKLSPIDDFETSKVLSNLVTTGIIEIIGEKKPEIIKRELFSKKLGLNNQLKEKTINGLIGIIIFLSILSVGYKIFLNYNIKFDSSISEFLKKKREKIVIKQMELYRIRNQKENPSIENLKIKQYGFFLKGMPFEGGKEEEP